MESEAWRLGGIEFADTVTHLTGPSPHPTRQSTRPALPSYELAPWERRPCRPPGTSLKANALGTTRLGWRHSTP